MKVEKNNGLNFPEDNGKKKVKEQSKKVKPTKQTEASALEAQSIQGRAQIKKHNPVEEPTIGYVPPEFALPRVSTEPPYIETGDTIPLEPEFEFNEESIVDAEPPSEHKLEPITEELSGIPPQYELDDEPRVSTEPPYIETGDTIPLEPEFEFNEESGVDSDTPKSL